MFYVWKYTCSRFTITIITIFWHKVSIPFHIICIVYSYLINFFQFWLISKLLQHFNLVFKYIYFCLLKMSLKVSKYFQFFVTAVGGFTMPLMPKLKFLYVWLGCGKERSNMGKYCVDKGSEGLNFFKRNRSIPM